RPILGCRVSAPDRQLHPARKHGSRVLAEGRVDLLPGSIEPCSRIHATEVRVIESVLEAINGPKSGPSSKPPFAEAPLIVIMEMQAAIRQASKPSAIASTADWINDW